MLHPFNAYGSGCAMGTGELNCVGHFVQTEVKAKWQSMVSETREKAGTFAGPGIVVNHNRRKKLVFCSSTSA